ncbi:11689_t:CDS:2, partial [Cetraspora pellucida]
TSNNPLGIFMARNNGLFDKLSSAEYKQGLYRRAVKELKITKPYSKKKQLKEETIKIIKDLYNQNTRLSQKCTDLNNKLDKKKRLKLKTMLPALQDPTLCEELNKCELDKCLE